MIQINVTKELIINIIVQLLDHLAIWTPAVLLLKHGGLLDSWTELAQ